MNEVATSETFRKYIFFWIGQLFSLLGSSIVQFVIIWWITNETESPIYVSIAAFLSFLPMVIISPLAGVYVDRWNRKLIIAISDSFQALTTFFIIILFITNITNVWIVIILNSLRGLCQAFHFPTVNAIIPIMVPKKYLSRINGINYFFTGIVQIFGPIISAFLSAIWPIQLILWSDIITFFIAITALLLIKIPSILEKNKIQASFKEDFRIGIEVLKNVPGLIILLVLVSAVNFLSAPFNTLMPLFVKVEHFGTAADLAIVMALIQVGMISGAFIASIKKNWRNKVKVIMLGIIFAVLGRIIATLSPQGFTFLIGIGGLIRSAMIPIINTNYLTIIQTNVKPETQGRVLSIVMAIATAVTPIAMIISGPLAEIMGIIPLFLFFAFLEFLSVVVTWLFTNIKHVSYEKTV
jgi:DHA3 family macrolide efflux protein-like MFS transporter